MEFECSLSGNWQRLTFGKGSYEQQYGTLYGLYVIFFRMQNVFTKLSQPELPAKCVCLYGGLCLLVLSKE